MILDYKVKEKALKNIRGKWLSLGITFAVFSIFTVLFTCIYELLTIDLRNEILRLEEHLNTIDILTASGYNEFIAVLENLSLANLALTIYSLIDIVGQLLSGAFVISISQIFIGVARGGDHKIKDTRKLFVRLKEGFILNLIKTVYIFLWSLLFIIPGIIKTFAYSMSAYIKAEHPEMGYREALRASETFMMGYKKRFFYFYLSFIGWFLLTGVADMVIWSIFPADNALLIVGNILSMIAYIPLSVYIEASSVNYFFAIHEEKERLNLNRQTSRNLHDAFSEFDRARERVNNDPFDNFEDKDKNNTGDNDPFKGF